MAATAIGLATGGISAVKQAMTVISDLMDATIPWKDFREIIKRLKESKDQYSNEAASVVGEVAKLLLDSSDSYVLSVNNVDNWCKSAVQHLEVYLNLFAGTKDKGTAEAQKILLLTVLNDGQAAISKALDDLNTCNERFNVLTAKLIELETIFENDFRESSAYFENSLKQLRKRAYGGAAAGVLFFGPIGLAISYSIAAGVVEGNMVPELKRAFRATRQKFANLQKTLVKAKTVLQSAKDDINEEITRLNNISSQISTTNGFANAWAAAPAHLFESLKKSTNELIRICTDYSASAQSKRATNWM